MRYRVPTTGSRRAWGTRFGTDIPGMSDMPGGGRAGRRSGGAGWRSGGADAVAAAGRGAVAVAGDGEAADQFGAQVLGFDDVVDDEFGGEAQDVDVLLVVAAQAF